MARKNQHGNVVGLGEAIQALNEMSKLVKDDKWVQSVQYRRANKHFIPAMKRNSKSKRLPKMIGITRAKKYVKSPRGIRMGVIKNDADLFPKFTAQATASVIEYGTDERFRELSKFGITTGRQSTGEMPSAPFLRPAYDNNVGAFMADVEQTFLKKIEEKA